MRFTQNHSSLTVWLAALLACQFCFDNSARSDFQFSNLAGVNFNSPASLGGIGNDGGVSVGFTLSANASPLLITSVEMFVARNSGATNGQATLQLRTGSTIASTLFAFQGVDITTNFVNQQPLQAVVFTPVNPVLLQASQTYWLTVSSTFVAPTNGLVIGTGDAPIVNDATFAGNRFGDYDAQITPLPSNLTPLIRVNGVTAVPEPSACGLLAVTLIASWCGLRRSRIGRFPLPESSTLPHGQSCA